MDQINPQSSPPPQPRPVMSGCLKALLVVAAILVVAMLALGFVVWRTVSWLQNAVTPTPVTAAPLNLSAGEKEDVQRVARGLHEAKMNKTEFDEYMTPAVFNGVFEQILKGEKEKGKKGPEFLRVEFDGENIKVKTCAQNEDTSQGVQYWNGEAVFQLEIKDGEVKQAELAKLFGNGREAPSVIMWIVRNALKQKLEEQKTRVGKDENPLGAIRLLKREKDRIHLVLDGKKIKD
jgi:hypothetical protein